MRKCWIISIGIQDYGKQVNLSDLGWGVINACRVYDIFTRKFNFDGILLVQKRDVPEHFKDLRAISEGEGKREDIIHGINVIRRKMGPEDVFVFFYAGHSKAEPEALIPFGGILDRTSSHLLYADLCGELCALPCKEQILFFDCYFSGGPGGPAHPAVRRRGQNNAALSALRTPAMGSLLCEGRNGATTRFTCSLSEYLEEMAAGDELSLIQLSAKIERDYKAHTDYSQQQTYLRDPLPEFGPSTGSVSLVKPGLSLLAPRTITCQAQVLSDIEVHLGEEYAGTSQDLQWSLAPGQAGLKPACCWICGPGKWKLQLDMPGKYPFLAKAKDIDNDEEVIRSIDIIVKQGRPQPLFIVADAIMPCLKGKAFSEKLCAGGGSPPYRWTVENLPEELRYDETQGTIHGLIPESPGAGTAAGCSRKPVVYILHVSVTDALGKVHSGYKRLLVISEGDYCLIKEGNFYVGYQYSPANEAAIRKMAQDLAYRAVAANGIDPKRLPASSFKGYVNGELDRLNAELSHLNPGGDAYLESFYIRKYPVTNREWNEFVAAHPNVDYKPKHWGGQYPEDLGNCPVSGLPYESIKHYLAWRGTRLPTAWEYERAARGRDGRLFPWGNDFDHKKCNIYQPGERREIVTVDAHDGVYQGLSDEGVRDLVGNVSEWIERRVTYELPKPLRKKFYNKYGDIKKCFAQVFRGGSFADVCTYALSFRDSQEAGLLMHPELEDVVLAEADTERFPWVGFRDVIDLQADPGEPQGLVEQSASTVFIKIKNETHKHTVKPFRMARYQVSNYEYYAFVKHTNTKYPKDWAPESEDIPFPWEKRHFPVVNVTYHEAMAFCLWKSRETGEMVRLPSLPQWVAAATNSGETEYPWGDAFQPQYCNSSASGWGRRLPVHALPHGRNKARVLNLVGNTYEWISPSEACGGSWQDDCNHPNFRATVRCPDRNAWCRPDFGFRYIVIDED